MSALEPRVSELEQALMRTLFVQQKTELEIQDLNREMRDFKNEMKDFKNEMNKKWGDLANKMGTIVEDIVAPNIPQIGRKYFGFDAIDHLMVRNYRRTPDRRRAREFDLIAVYRDEVIWNTTKSSPSVEYIDQFASEIANQELEQFFPELKGMKVIPIFSSIAIRADLVTSLTRNGIFALAMTGSTMDLLNASELLDSTVTK